MHAAVKIKAGEYGHAIGLLLERGGAFQTRHERTLIVNSEQKRTLEAAGLVETMRDWRSPVSSLSGPTERRRTMKTGVPSKAKRKVSAKVKSSERLEVRQSSGNVFRDLGLPQPEELLAKAQLANRICEIIRERGLTQARAAQLLALDQPKVSNLMRGRLEGFSIERLIRFLNSLDQEVEITVRQAPATGQRAGTTVIVT